MMFLHGGWLHLILNMWTLWLFGGAVEDRMGSSRYIAFYLACGVAAAVAHAVFNPTSTVPALGASSAIAGVMGCYMRLFAWSRVIVVIPILFLPLLFEMPAAVFIGLWFVLQVLQGAIDLLAPSSGGVAWWAHGAGSWRGSRSVRCWCAPNAPTASISPTKANTGSLRWVDEAEVNHRRQPCLSATSFGSSSCSRRFNRCSSSA
jgi:membrane associated rhomboid family serine protease